MARKRRGTAKRTAGARRGAARRTQQAARKRRPARRGARAGARATRREEAARQVERAAAAAGYDPELEQAAQPPPAAPWAGEAEGIPGYARLVSEPKDLQADARRRQKAEAELARRREAAEREAGDVPGLREIGIELAIGAMRLARTVATAPIRIGLAFLRDG